MPMLKYKSPIRRSGLAIYLNMFWNVNESSKTGYKNLNINKNRCSEEDNNNYLLEPSP